MLMIMGILCTGLSCRSRKYCDIFTFYSLKMASCKPKHVAAMFF